MSKRRIVVVYNRKSGSAVGGRELRLMFESAGFEVREMIPVDSSVQRNVKKHVKKDAWIAAVGGDGTVSLVAGLVAGTGAVLVPIPGGTLNNFTKDLQVAQDTEQAIKDAASGKVHKVDIASVNGGYFVNNSSIGIYSRSLDIRDSSRQLLGKWPTALYGILRTLVLFRTYKVTLNDKSIVTPFVFVGNNKYHLEKAGLSNRTKLDAGVLSVYAVNSDRRWALFRIFFRSLFGIRRSDKELIAYHTKELTIETSRRRMHVSRDGELDTCTPPLKYEIHAGALRVVTTK